ncbi:MAG: HAMP domain-containing methyl-accepting chemotaxis protein, partial [Clostridiaceae bacterium]|nr:HAMP domain-containing methyl-accepting chemotaxis protein [Clostridiaceae bacterium]
MIKRFVLNNEIKKVIIALSVLACIFASLLGGISFVMISKMCESADYIYSYQYFSNIIDDIHENISVIKINELKARDEYLSEYEENIKKSNSIVLEKIAEYNSTENEEEEEIYINNIEKHYGEFYDIVIKNLETYKNELDKDDNGAYKSQEEIENSLYENIIAITDYLNTWADSDMEDINKQKVHLLVFLLVVIIVCATIFVTYSIIVAKLFSTEVNEIKRALEEISKGDLTISLDCHNKNEFDEMKSYINILSQNINNIVLGLKNKSSHIEDRTLDLSNTSSDLSSSMKNVHEVIENISEGTEEQASDMEAISNVLAVFSKNIEEFTNSLSYLDANSINVIEIAKTGNTKIDDLSVSFNTFGELVKSFINKISTLSNTVEEISGITNLINDIAEQTNLLALNASIESARVGEAGKGFAVVADEIRILAEQSRESATNITNLINHVSIETKEIVNDGHEVAQKINYSKTIIGESVNSFKQIVKEVNNFAEKVYDLSKVFKSINNEN